MESDRIVLTQDQEEALQAILEGKNVFLTGPAGSGKNTVLNRASMHMEQKGVAVARCSLSRMGALRIDGMSLHTFFDLPLNLFREEGLCIPNITKLMKVQALFVNYIHTCTPPLIDILWNALSMADKEGHSIQIVFSGDPFGLNSVIDGETEGLYEDITGLPLRSWSPFLSRHWNDFKLEAYELKNDMRHRDKAEALCLEELRLGRKSGINRLELLTAGRPVPNGIWICSSKSDVKAKNNELAKKLEGEPHTFRASHYGNNATMDCPLPEVLVLKKNIPVIMVLNVPAKSLTSGMVGKVVDIREEKLYVSFPNRKGRILLEKQSWKDPDGAASVIQFPVDVGFAVTAYRARYMELECANICGKLLQKGQLYTVASRVKNLNRLFIDHHLSPKEANVDMNVRRWYQISIKGKPAGSPDTLIGHELIPYKSRQGLRFGLLNVYYANFGFTRSFICLRSVSDKMVFAVTDYDKYIRKRRRKSDIHSNLGDSVYFIIQFLNYAFIDGPERVNALTGITPKTIQGFVNAYAMGLYGRENATHTKETIDRCIAYTLSFLMALVDDPDIEMGITYKDLFVPTLSWSSSRGVYESMEMAFDVHYDATEHKTLRDMPPEVVQAMVAIAYKKYPRVLINIALGLCAGLRPSETCLLSLDSIQIVRSGKRLSQVIIKLTNRIDLRSDETKVGKAKVPRTATIQPMFLRLFDALYTRYEAWRKAQKADPYYRPLCVDTNGNAMTYDTLLRHFDELMQDVVDSLKDSKDPRTILFIDQYLKDPFGLHILRHIYTLDLILGGYNIVQTMNARGDRSPESAAHYLQNKGDLIEKMNEAVNKLTDFILKLGGTF